MMGEHAPQAPQRFRRDSRTELRNVALQAGADEILPPAQAARGIRRQQAVRKSATHPQIVGRQASRFQHTERRELQVRDPPGQAFAGLLQQVQRGRAEQQALAGASPGPTRPVDEPPQHRKQPGHAMDFVENHQLVLMVRQIKLRLRQPGAILLGFQFEIECVECPVDLERQRGLARLTRAKQAHCRRVDDRILQAGGQAHARSSLQLWN